MDIFKVSYYLHGYIEDFFMIKYINLPINPDTKAKPDINTARPVNIMLFYTFVLIKLIVTIIIEYEYLIHVM